MKYKAVKEALGQVPAEITVEPYLTPDHDDDPMGVFKVEPAHSRLSKLYNEMDPERDDDFEKRVHGANRAYAQLIQHHFLHFEKLLDLLEYVNDYLRIGVMEVTMRGVVDQEAFHAEIKRALRAARRVQE